MSNKLPRKIYRRKKGKTVHIYEKRGKRQKNGESFVKKPTHPGVNVNE
jgi:hypothetical protein